MIPLPIAHKELGVLLVVGIGLLAGYTVVTPGPEEIEDASLHVSGM